MQSQLIYSRCGGVAGLEDEAIIDPDGVITVRGRWSGERSGRLSEEQRRELEQLLARLPKPSRRFRFTPRVMDDLSVQIRCAGATYEWQDAPAPFTQVTEWLEDAIAALPAPAVEAPDPR